MTLMCAGLLSFGDDLLLVKEHGAESSKVEVGCEARSKFGTGSGGGGKTSGVGVSGGGAGMSGGGWD